ncbi:MAG: hypothetical protein JRI68_24910 [Deltaproteobacteria bacterium]|nr:hypothetical protein [Deltaproteobacteria bacterium]
MSPSQGALRWLGRYWMALVPLVGVGELAADRWLAARAPGFGDYAKLTEPVARLRQPADLVLVAPRWAEPMVRHALGDDIMPIEHLGRPDLSGHATALEVSVLGQRSPELADWRELDRQTHGAFLLRRLENPAHQPVKLDFVDALSPDRAEVWTEGNSRCHWQPKARVLSGGLGGHPTFPRERFQCPGGSFFNVGVTVIADEDFRPRRCLWAHPPRRGELRIRYRDVTLGQAIVGHGGLYWIIERERRGAPIELRVRVDGDEVGRATHVDGDGWSAFELDLGEHAGKTGATVEFAVSSQHHQHRHFCFEARTR